MVHGTSDASGPAPAFTVVVATFRRGSLIEATLESIARQAWPSFEVLVVSDGPAEPGLAETVDRLDSRFRLVVSPVRAGSQSGPNNLGWSLARGRYVAYLGHDDIWHPDHLRLLADAFDATPGASFAVSGCVYFGPAGTWDELTWVTGLFDAADETAPATHFFPPSSVAHRRDLPVDVPRWPDADRINRPVDGQFMIDAFEHGCRFTPTGVITVFKFASALRHLSYLSGDDEEQIEMLAVLDDPAATKARIAEAVDTALRNGHVMATRHADSDALDRAAVLAQNERVRGTEEVDMPRLDGAAWLPVDDRWLGFDWYPCEDDHGRQVRWSGPNHRPRLAIPFAAEAPVDFRVRVAGFANAEVRSSVQVLVDRRRVDIALESDAGGEAIRFTASLRSDRPTVIEFRTVRAVPVRELFPGSSDNRRVGFALIGVDLSPAPPRRRAPWRRVPS